MKFFSRITISISLLILFGQNPLFAMGNKTPLEPKKTKTELVSELFDTFCLDKLSIDDILQPFWDELKEVGFDPKPFPQTILKVKTALNEVSTPLLVLLKDWFARAHEKEFTEDELKELISLYKKPGVMKLSGSISSLMFGPILNLLKDQKLFNEFSQALIPAIMAVVQKSTKDNEELEKILQKEWEEFTKNAHYSKPEFLEKLKKHYPVLEPSLTKYFGDVITTEKIEKVFGEFVEEINRKYTKNLVSSEMPQPNVAQSQLPEGASK